MIRFLRVIINIYKGVKLMKNATIVTAAEKFADLADHLPKNLVIDTLSPQGLLVGNLLIQFSEKQLAELKEASKYINESFFINVFAISEKSFGKACPTEVKAFSINLSSDVVKIVFNGNTCPIVQKYAIPNRFVSVTLVTKE